MFAYLQHRVHKTLKSDFPANKRAARLGRSETPLTTAPTPRNRTNAMSTATPTRPVKCRRAEEPHYAMSTAARTSQSLDARGTARSDVDCGRDKSEQEPGARAKPHGSSTRKTRHRMTESSKTDRHALNLTIHIRTVSRKKTLRRQPATFNPREFCN